MVCFVYRTLVVLLVIFFISPAGLPAQSESDQTRDSKNTVSGKIVLGEVEEVTLLPWQIKLPARIDTGAELSSIDARDVSIRNNSAEFKLGRRHGGAHLTLPLAGWRRIRTSTGTADRPVVELCICLGPKLVRTLATLSDRSEMSYPFLVGRSALNGTFMVDPSRSKAAHPVCPKDALQQVERAYEKPLKYAEENAPQ
ncbi:MAG TPA: RimK/LysX family protein [Candidatus Binatia bacterium]|jgi:hypothetical protein